MGVNPYPLVYIGDLIGLFFCRGYEYGVVIPGGYLPLSSLAVPAFMGWFTVPKQLPPLDVGRPMKMAFKASIELLTPFIFSCRWIVQFYTIKR
jgi:hypothetical protein